MHVVVRRDHVHIGRATPLAAAEGDVPRERVLRWRDARAPIPGLAAIALCLAGDRQRGDVGARDAVGVDLKSYLHPITKLLSEIVIQVVMHHPEYMRLRRIPAMTYIFMHGGIFTVLQHLSDPNPPITYEELTEGLAEMVTHYVAREMQLTKVMAPE